jgi:hypothetical protein
MIRYKENEYAKVLPTYPKSEIFIITCKKSGLGEKSLSLYTGLYAINPYGKFCNRLHSHRSSHRFSLLSLQPPDKLKTHQEVQGLFPQANVHKNAYALHGRHFFVLSCSHNKYP